MSAAIAAPTGLPPTFRQIVTDACDVISEAPATHLHRATLSGIYRCGRATQDPGELAEAIAQLRDASEGRDLSAEDFDAVRASAIEIASRRRA
jgi:hypothetical protein